MIDAIEDLNNILNPKNKPFCTKWDNFTMQFRDWLKAKLMPHLLEEIEIRKKIHAL